MTKEVRIGKVVIGGGNPIAIQSMANVDPHDEKALIDQVVRLSDNGCDIMRLTVPDQEAADVFGRVKSSLLRSGYDIPLVADIHFDYRMAIEAIKNGADKIRINPGNIGSIDRVREVVNCAKEHAVPIRVGVNSGSLEKHLIEKYHGVTAQGIAESALENLKIIEDLGYDDLVVSIKSSDVRMTYEAHKILVKSTDHPVHIGITEAGTLKSEEGKFWLEEINVHHADWMADPGASEVSDFDHMIAIEGGKYEDEAGDFRYTIYLRPWGMDWRGQNTGHILSRMRNRPI